MSAEDYHDVPGFGGGAFRTFKPRDYACNHCSAPITFVNRRPMNIDGTPHRCLGRNAKQQSPVPIPSALDNSAAVLFAMSAMNAIIQGQIQAGGIDHIHHMNFYDVADASWRMASAMVSAEKNYRDEFGAPA